MKSDAVSTPTSPRRRVGAVHAHAHDEGRHRVARHHQADRRGREVDRAPVHREIEGEELDAGERHAAHDERAPEPRVASSASEPPGLLVARMDHARGNEPSGGARMIAARHQRHAREQHSAWA